MRDVGSRRPEGRVMDQHYPLFYVFFFYLFGVIALASAIAFVTRRSPVAAALWLVNTMFSLAALFVMLDAQFIGVMQVLIYAGAIMVVFLFVVMLLNLGHPSELADARGKGWKFAAALVGLGLLSEIMVIARTKLPEQLIVPRDFNEQQLQKLNAVGTIAQPLFKDYLLAFELTSVLLLVAIAGAVVLARGRAAGAR
jgi:NADH-quinone oxidoreductase subunit J